MVLQHKLVAWWLSNVLAKNIGIISSKYSRLLSGYVGVLMLSTDEEESVEQFIRRNLGDEVFERLIEPFCSGVYAGNPAKLSMKAAFNRVSCTSRMTRAAPAAATAEVAKLNSIRCPSEVLLHLSQQQLHAGLAGSF
jgi:protoporphyrinogen oxidase